jgi:Tol biopolymer transport system component
LVSDGSELYIVAADGGARARLIAVEEGSVFAPAWSPTDEVIAYIEETQEGRKIRLVHSDHTPLQDVATGSVTPSGGLSWSPDGARLAFAGEDGDLYIVDIVSSTTTPALTMPGRIEGTTWSGNGTTIVFSATREENPTQYFWDLYSIDLDDGELRMLTTSGQDRSPDLCRVADP